MVVFPRPKRRQEGVTLVEVLIVVAVMSLVAGMATVLAFPELKKARIRTAAMGADAVRRAAEIHRDIDLAGDTTVCPSVQDLIAARKLDRKRSDDPWGRAYAVECETEEVHGISAGADRRYQTADDVRDDIKPADVERISKL